MLHHHDHGGTGPAVVLLHAFPLDSGTFDRLVPLLAGRARVVTIDLPGLGRSAVPTENPTMEAAATAVLDVMDALGLGRSVVLGISTGGYAALQLAAQAPERLAGLVLGSTTPHRVEPDVPDERLAVADEIESSGSTEAVADSADEGLGSTAHREQPELVDQLRRTIAAADPAGVAWMARAIAARHDTADVLATFEAPVVLLFGDEDEATPPARGDEMRALRGGLPTRLVVLPETGHLTALESPQEVADVIDDLLRELGGG
ncbi:alpha/beta fold hydrolase [Aeromicrobium fastidiosum]|uniref:Alpha/beta fold hydrolase n=1 Tax=Aeromicrobium fastidiosum TaxID=52699 RepID=A0A641AJP8_9ACTN|nr:alpha/beta hydrolase [Aeromicrobium fastidiosum]KAA1374635.1 alpha/beta fold hydrolase [Aeromicrobium fastidiosum]MBP2390819.1 pimeloyl-ACP methyl ester carboxylesterase [Aeromicrobium fastidiosum]